MQGGRYWQNPEHSHPVRASPFISPHGGLTGEQE